MQPRLSLNQAIAVSLLVSITIGVISGYITFSILEPPLQYGHINEACIGCAIIGLGVGVLFFLTVFLFLFKALFKLNPKVKRVFVLIMVTLIAIWNIMIIPVFF